MRVLICGTCSWPEVEPIWADMADYQMECELADEPLAFISGMAPGADTIAYEVANELDVFCDDFPWNKWGRRKARYITNAEPHKMRNQWMLDSGVDVCLAYAYNLPSGSFGTRDMVNRCVRAGVPTITWFDGENKYKITERVVDDTDRTTLEVVA